MSIQLYYVYTIPIHATLLQQTISLTGQQFVFLWVVLKTEFVPFNLKFSDWLFSPHVDDLFEVLSSKLAHAHLRPISCN